MVMKLVHMITKGKVYAVLILGDGVFDERVVNALSKRFDHRGILLSPRIRPRKTGLKGSIETIAFLVNRKLVYNTILLVIDKEHIGSINELADYLKEYGFSITGELIKLNDYSWKIMVSRGSFYGCIYVSIQGFRKCIEENIVELISLLYGVSVKAIEPTRASIKRFLKMKNTSLEEIIEKAGEEILFKAFPGLYSVLKDLYLTT